MELMLSDAGFLALGNGSFRWQQATAVAAVLLGDSYRSDAQHDEYEDVDSFEINDADYAQQAVTTRLTSLVDGAGSPTLKEVRYTSDAVSFGSSVTISARYLALVVGVAGSLGHADLLLGVVDFGEVKSSTSSTFSFTPAATGWMRIVPA